MKLTELLHRAGLPSSGIPDLTITGLSADSRLIKPGNLFAALHGTRADGAQYIKVALARGAVAVLGPEGTTANAPVITTDNPRLAIARMAAAFYAPAPETIAAVTGTNGKTSTVNFTAQLWNACGHKAASMGTIGIMGPGFERPGSLTTPDPVALSHSLQELKAAGFDHVAIEASSHGIDQHRLDGLTLKVAGFTYLGRDHLDYHGTIEGYFKAKSDLFARLLPSGGTAVVNADTPEYTALARIAQERGQHLISYGRNGKDLQLVSCTPQPDGLALSLNVFGQSLETLLPVTGSFQAHNALCALGMVIGSGVASAQAAAKLGALRSPRGRLEYVGKTPAGAGIYVDYAHTPDALETILKAMRAHTSNKLVVAFGCGGNRDKGKRPAMGKIAIELADRVIVTDDNPRNEDPAEIRRDIMLACPAAQEIGDRATAIQTAIQSLQSGDILVIAGKGHEQGQIVGTKVRPFDDAEVVRGVLGIKPA